MKYFYFRANMDYGENNFINHDDLHVQYDQRNVNIIRERLDPFHCKDKAFWSRYRFTKNSVRRLAEMVFPEPFQGQRGPDPFDRYQVTCMALHLLAGANFQRVEGDCAGGSASSAHRQLYKFMHALKHFKDEFVHMPTRAMMEENSRAIQAKKCA